MTNELKTTPLKFTDYMNKIVVATSHSINYSTTTQTFGYQNVPHLILKDGTQLSIQASRTHYCSPRANAAIADYDWYQSFEIGYPTKIISELIEYAENPKAPTDTVYAYVPKELIQQIVYARGGVVGWVDYETQEEHTF